MSGSLGFTWQPSLFEAEEPSFDQSFANIQRVLLDPTAWVDHAPGWVRGADKLFGEVLESRDWGQRARRMFDKRVLEPRLTSPWSAGSGEPLEPPLIEQMRVALSKRYEVDFRLRRVQSLSRRARQRRLARRPHQEGDRGTDRCPPFARGYPSLPAAAQRRRSFNGIHAGPRRSAGNGREDATHLGAQRSQGRPGRPPNQSRLPTWDGSGRVPQQGGRGSRRKPRGSHLSTIFGIPIVIRPTLTDDLCVTDATSRASRTS